MPTTIVIADLHLSQDRPDITRCFTEFLAQNKDQHDALYILGDLFEVWVGDDDDSQFTASIANHISDFATNTPVYFIHGNRDFLLGKKYAKRCNMKLLDEAYKTELYGRDVLFMHGDQLCLDDVEYQRFRRKSRSWWWQTLLLMLPLKMRQKKAADYRARSKQEQANKPLDIMDVNQQEVERVVKHSGVDWLIHGHTHRPNIHNLDNSNKRIVVGDWYTQGSVLTLSAKGYELSSLPFN